MNETTPPTIDELGQTADELKRANLKGDLAWQLAVALADVDAATRRNRALVSAEDLIAERDAHPEAVALSRCLTALEELDDHAGRTAWRTGHVTFSVGSPPRHHEAPVVRDPQPVERVLLHLWHTFGLEDPRARAVESERREAGLVNELNRANALLDNARDVATSLGFELEARQ